MKHFPDDITAFIKAEKWHFSKTSKQIWPHEYLVHKEIPTEMYCRILDHIIEHGKLRKWYSKKNGPYIVQDGMAYFFCATEGHAYTDPNGCINRTFVGLTFEPRERRGVLPYAAQWKQVNHLVVDIQNNRWNQDIKSLAPWALEDVEGAFYE